MNLGVGKLAGDDADRHFAGVRQHSSRLIRRGDQTILARRQDDTKTAIRAGSEACDFAACGGGNDRHGRRVRHDVGRRIDALEARLGVKLMVRTTRRITLTHEGSAFLEDCQRLLADWGARHRDANPPRHAACGTPLEARWYCPTCERPVEEDGGAAEELHFA